MFVLTWTKGAFLTQGKRHSHFVSFHFLVCLFINLHFLNVLN